MTEWNIQSRSHACAACEVQFEDKQVYHTVLLHGDEGYSRRDLCSDCFTAAARAEALSYWQGEYRAPAPPPPEPLQKETAETLLRKLVESTDPTHAAARYILAVMLERKRILKHRDTVQDEAGNDLLIYEHAKTGDSFTIPDPHLRLDQLAEIQEQVAGLLHPSASAEAPVPESVEAGSQTEEAGTPPAPASDASTNTAS
jgi:hypothetical protein